MLTVIHIVLFLGVVAFVLPLWREARQTQVHDRKLQFNLGFSISICIVGYFAKFVVVLGLSMFDSACITEECVDIVPSIWSFWKE